MVDRLLENDWVLRILSILLAIGIWAQVTSQNPTVNRPFHGLQISVQNTGSLRVRTTPSVVSVELVGPMQIVDAVKPGAIRVYVTAPSASPGRYTVPVKVVAPIGGTQVVAVQPAQATIILSSQSGTP